MPHPVCPSPCVPAGQTRFLTRAKTLASCYHCTLLVGSNEYQCYCFTFDNMCTIISYIVLYPVVLDVCKGKFLLLSLRVVTIIGAPFLLSLEINLTSLSPLLSFPLLLVRSAVIYNHMIVLEICILFSLLLCFGDNFLHLCWS